MDSINQLTEFLKIKSISAQKEYAPDMQKARNFLVQLFGKMGFSTKILKAKIHDAVFAEKIIDPKLPTVLVYGHYDVQPPEPLGEWKTKPFEPTIKAGKIFARGASDDKGQIMANIMAGMNAPINLKYIIEGEEEVGSVSVEELAKKYSKNLFKCDYLLVSDSEMLSKTEPTIDISLRGICYMEIALESAKHDLHSGCYGGVAENPANVLARIISKLKDEDGKVLIPGFYKNIDNPTEKELRDFKAIKVSKNSLMEEGEFETIGGGEPEFSLNERRWTRPTLDVNGMVSGYVGEGSKTIIPSRASAKISMRLVPNQKPAVIAKLFSSYVKSLVPKGFKLTVTNHSGALPYKAPTKDPVFSLAKEALTKAFGGKAVFDGVGGSIGFVPIVAKELKVPCLLIGFGLPTDNIHAPNEHLVVANYLNGIKAIQDLFSKIGKQNVK